MAFTGQAQEGAQQSLGINVNPYRGSVLLVFGALMFALSRLGARTEARAGAAPESPRSTGH
jgi:hypothetical protein